MPILFSWYIKAHGPVFLAHGIVSGHPKLPEGEAVHTSSLIRAEEEENGLLLKTQSGSVYHVRAEEFSARESRPELPPPERLGLAPEIWERCALARERAAKAEKDALLGLHASAGTLRLRVAGAAVLSALWCGREGQVRRVPAATHLGMFQDSVLIRDFFEDEDGPCQLDFRYFPYPNRLEPYEVSEDIKKILLVNDGARDVSFGYGQRKTVCPAKTAAVIDTADWRGAPS